jgi:exonuclease III
MNTNHPFKQWKVLCWNVRGLSAHEKWGTFRDRISESGCDIICLQETKRRSFDIAFIKKFCPSTFDSFEYLPSISASGGLSLFGSPVS